MIHFLILKFLVLGESVLDLSAADTERSSAILALVLSVFAGTKIVLSNIDFEGGLDMKTIFFSTLLMIASSPALAQNQPLACTPQETSQIAAEVERATLAKVRQDIRAEGRVQSTALGLDDRDCLERARRQVQDQAGRAIEKCVSETVYFRACEVSDIRVVRTPSRLEPVIGNYKIDDYKTNQAQCQADAERRAVDTALEGCRNTYNRGCRLVDGPTRASHAIERRRRYGGLVGPKEDFHVCHSSARALPDSREQVQCTMELIAKVRIL